MQQIHAPRDAATVIEEIQYSKCSAGALIHSVNFTNFKNTHAPSALDVPDCRYPLGNMIIESVVNAGHILGKNPKQKKMNQLTVMRKLQQS